MNKRYTCYFRKMFLIFFLLLSLNSYSQEPLIVTKITGGITFDGVPDEDAWKQAPYLPLTMHMPVYGNEPTESSVIKIVYDEDYFFISGIFNYKDPSTIRAFGKKRDFNGNCDWFGFILDSFNDKQNAVGFWTNPNGIRTDGTVKNDLAGTGDVSFSWNTFWDVKTIINDNEWTTEIRIPFSSLRFQVVDGKTHMGITILRFDAAKSEGSTFPAISPDYKPVEAWWKPSLTFPIVFEGLKPKKPVYITPYVTAGLSQAKELNEAKTAYKMKSTPKFDAGLDAKYSITNNLTMDMTVNTDFAQVEADDQKINLTRYSLFLPEKRTFFLEKNDVFNFSFQGGDNLFYSRRIGIYDDHPVRIYGGLRLTGRVNKWDLGILDMQTAPFEDKPGENFGVFRTKRTVFNQNSFVGGMFTSRLGMNGSSDLAYGIDGQFRVTGNEYLTVKLAQTFKNDSANKIFDLAPSRLYFQWERRNQKGFNYDFMYTYSGEKYNPGIGFEIKDNYQAFRGILRYGWFPAKEAVIMYHKISFTGYSLLSTLTGLQETVSGELNWYFEAKKGFSGSIFSTWNHEDITDTLILGNYQAFVPPGKYSFANISLRYNTSRRYTFSASFQSEAGRFYDGWKFSLSATPKVNIGSGLELGLTYALDFVNFPDRDMSFTNHIAGMRGLLSLSTKTSLLSFVQYNTSVDKVVTNIRLRYNPREGNDFYIVYDEGLNTNILKETPALPHSSGRTILLKYTYTFMF